MTHPLWNPSAKSASLRKWAEHLHKESKREFLKDGTHAQLLFLFKDEGPVSITPVPPNSNHMQVYNGIRKAIRQHHLYGVIHIGEAWTYFPKNDDDHTAFQLLDGEMRVADLKDEDRTEALYLRMESKDGDCVVYVDKIARKNGQVELGESRKVEGEELKWFEEV
jgi:hypothetical protein